MKYCELCNIENPDDARFCMKCGKDLDAVGKPDDSPDVLDVDSFTPAGSLDMPSSKPPVKKDSGPLPDVVSYKEAAFADAESQESFGSSYQEDDTPEIHMTDVTTDFTERKRICGVCGSANPLNQRYCRHCGSELGNDAPEARGNRSAPQSLAAGDGPMEHATLADVAPSSGDYYATERVRERRGREGGGFSGTVSDWGTREWLILIVAAIVIALLIWFFGFGGMNFLFNSGAGDIKKAGNVMTGMTGCRYNVAATMESADAVYGGNGELMYESPDKTAWQLTLSIPGGGPVLTQHVVVDDECFSNCGDAWRVYDKDCCLGIDSLWNGISGLEKMGNESMLNRSCLHYRYRIPPGLVTSVTCADDQSGVSDTVIDMWIDEESHHIVRVTADTFNVQIRGVRTKASLVMDLAVTDQAFGISAPR